MDGDFMSNYRELNIILLGTMLANGSRRSKAEILFDAYDTETTGKLDKKAVKSLLLDLHFTICKALTKIAQGESEDQIPSAQMSLYEEVLDRGQGKGIDQILKTLFKEDEKEITRKAFVNKFGKKPDLLTTSGFRAFFEQAGEIKFAKWNHGPGFVTEIDQLVKNEVEKMAPLQI